MFAIAVHTDIEKFQQLAEPWQALATVDPVVSLFNTYAWAENWVHHFWTPDYSLHVVLISEHDRPVALLPLYLSRLDGRARFLGSGEPEHCEVASEYLDFLLDPGYPNLPFLKDEIASYLTTVFKRPLELINCLQSSHAMDIASRCRHVINRPVGKRFRIALSSPFEDVYRAFSKNQRKKSRELLNRFDQSTTLDFQRLQNDNYQDNWQNLRALHIADWNSRGKTGAFGDPRFSEFHRRMREQYPQIQQLFFALLNEGKVVAVNHYYLDGNTCYYYTSGTDRHAGVPSPGTLLHLLFLRSCTDTGLCQDLEFYDFMKGALQGSYKEKFCAADEILYTLLLFPRTLSGSCAWYRSRIRSLASKIRHRLRRSRH